MRLTVSLVVALILALVSLSSVRAQEPLLEPAPEPDEVMQAEGLVKHEGEWVQPVRKAMLEAIRDTEIDPQRERIRNLPDFFRHVGEAGEVVPGMSKREVIRALSEEYPTSFDRVLRDGNLYDAWIYEDGRVFYFENDLLFTKS